MNTYLIIGLLLLLGAGFSLIRLFIDHKKANQKARDILKSKKEFKNIEQAYLTMAPKAALDKIKVDYRLNILGTAKLYRMVKRQTKKDAQ
ncbi:hypothetical protein R4Y45_04460 [Holzapfeliella sp. He02]|uniref:Uncharacterized protein n=1 Tax=Holzapfeliella saturejae TaxID=3082953 RepID=A0ABU8SGW4_9LACO